MTEQGMMYHEKTKKKKVRCKDMYEYECKYKPESEPMHSFLSLRSNFESESGSMLLISSSEIQVRGRVRIVVESEYKSMYISIVSIHSSEKRAKRKKDSKSPQRILHYLHCQKSEIMRERQCLLGYLIPCALYFVLAGSTYIMNIVKTRKRQG